MSTAQFWKTDGLRTVIDFVTYAYKDCLSQILI